MENRFTAWKFCHLLHKVLREGHETCIKHSQSHKKMILEMGKLWGHLHDGVGHCILSYSKLIVTKLDFHEKNAIFPGSLLSDFRDIEKFAGEDINVYFQLCVEIFDYIDEIIDVQSKVFVSINSYRMSSMTPQGQCRLAPLITLIQDSNPLYDLSVRIMFELHDKLPSDILSGHRDRFRDIFSKLKFFYNNVRPLQYFADLIQVPQLPEAAPNFRSKVDFGSYIPPVVVVPLEPETNPHVDNLVDMTNVQEENIMETKYVDDILSLSNEIKEKDVIVGQLKTELSELRNIMSSMQSSHQQDIHKLKDEISILNAELTDAKEYGTNMRVLKDELELQQKATPTLLQKVSEEEGRAKASEEKFNKLKHMYSQIRDEHIQLLRQHGETSKQLVKIKNENSALLLQIGDMRIQLKKSQEFIDTKEELLSNLKSNYEKKLKEVNEGRETIKIKFEELQDQHDKIQKVKLEELQQLTCENTQLLTDVKDFNLCKSKLNDLEEQLNHIKEKSHLENTEKCRIISDLNNELSIKTQKAFESEQLHKNEIDLLKAEMKNIVDEAKTMENIIKDKEVGVQKIIEEKIILQNELHDLLQKNSSYELKLSETRKDFERMNGLMHDNTMKYKGQIFAFMQAVLNTVKTMSIRKANSNEMGSFETILRLNEDLRASLNELHISYKIFNGDHDAGENFIRKAISVGFYFAMLTQNCTCVYSSISNFYNAQEILSKANLMCEHLESIFVLLIQSKPVDELEAKISSFKTLLDALNELVQDLLNTKNGTADIGDLVENEMAEMDKAIEEAAERFVQMLSSAKTVDNGIKLEVNEKILDACTNLMECIKLLIQKSKILQEEIVASGRGNASAKEFYKRNSQWSEGLISASKSVARGANLLVEAANKAVSGEPNKCLEIIVAAQEIAACTAQLVVASKVKAPNGSQKLVDLTKASRNISQATGAVVATVKDCNHQLDLSQEIDLTKLTANQVKTMEMDIHVKVLELEQALQVERMRLSSFRRQNYQNTED